MTAHSPKPTITPERVEWFARYWWANPTWGVFHVCLDDGNWECGAADRMHRPGTGVTVASLFVPSRHDVGRDEWPAELREHAEWFDSLTPSQRRRLGQKASRWRPT